MVLVKMLMEIDPLPMRGSLVMMMVMISPSRRAVSLAEQLRRSPRLVLPHGGRVSSRKLAYDFSRVKDFIEQKMATGGLLGGPQGRGRAPTLVDKGWPPSIFSSLSISY